MSDYLAWMREHTEVRISASSDDLQAILDAMATPMRLSREPCHDHWNRRLVPGLVGSLFPGLGTRAQSPFSDWRSAKGRPGVDELLGRRARGRTPAGQAGASEQPLVDTLSAVLERGIELRVEGRVCEAGPYEQVRAGAGFLRLGTRWACPTPVQSMADVELKVDVFFAQIPDHLHFAKTQMASAQEAGPVLTEWVLSAEQPQRRLGRPSTLGVFWEYLVLGVEHILIGIDHLAFVLALLILCTRIRDVVWLITGFTVGHSITLSLAVLGWVRPRNCRDRSIHRLHHRGGGRGACGPLVRSACGYGSRGPAVLWRCGPCSSSWAAPDRRWSR